MLTTKVKFEVPLELTKDVKRDRAGKQFELTGAYDGINCN